MQLFALSAHKMGVMQSWRWASIWCHSGGPLSFIYGAGVQRVARGNVPHLTRTPVSRQPPLTAGEPNTTRALKWYCKDTLVSYMSTSSSDREVSSRRMSSRLDNRSFKCYILDLVVGSITMTKKAYQEKIGRLKDLMVVTTTCR
jgi:hypothetical protein